MSGNIYGYVRVSTWEQNEDRQLIVFREIGVAEKNIFMDKQSGKDFERPQYKKTSEKNEKGRFALHQEYRPSGAQL